MGMKPLSRFPFQKLVEQKANILRLSYVTCSHTLKFAQDMKIAHYLKVSLQIRNLIYISPK